MSYSLIKRSTCETIGPSARMPRWVKGSVPIARDHRPASVGELSRREVRYGDSIDRDVSLGRFSESDQDLHQLLLAVPVHPGDAEDLPLPHLEAQIVEPDLPADIDQRQVAHRDHGLAWFQDRPLDPEHHVTPDHHPSELRLVRLRHGHRPDHRAVAEHRAAVGHGEKLVELVGDEDRRTTLVHERPQDRRQFLPLRRSQDGSGLVQHQEVRAPIQELEDLHPLLHTDGEVLDPVFGIDLEVVPGRELPDPDGHLPHA
jgi:hypothetical protein